MSDSVCVCEEEEEEEEEAPDSLATPSPPPATPFCTHTHSNLLHPVSEPSPVSNLLLISCQLGSDDEVIIVGGGR